MDTKIFNINRRHFIKGAAASLALSSFGSYGMELIYRDKPLRVGLIGAGWYGKSDLFRLMQVTKVNVVSICDVDDNLLKEAANLISLRQPSGKAPRTYRDYRKMLAEKDLDIVKLW